MYLTNKETAACFIEKAYGGFFIFTQANLLSIIDESKNDNCCFQERQLSILNSIYVESIISRNEMGKTIVGSGVIHTTYLWISN